MILELAEIAFKNLLKNKRKTLAALLSISSGFIALNLFQAYIHDCEILFDKTYSQRNMLGELLLRHEKKNLKIQEKEIPAIEDFLRQNKDLIATQVRFLQFSGSLNAGAKQAQVSGFGYDVQSGKEMRTAGWEQNTIAGSPLNLETAAEILVGRRLGEAIDCVQTNPMSAMIGKNGYKKENRPFTCTVPEVQLSLTTDSGQANALDAKVTGIIDGIFPELDQRLVYAPLSFVQQLTQSKDLSFYALKTKDAAAKQEIQNRFKERFGLNLPDLRLKSWRDYDVGEFYVKSMEFLYVFRDLITAVIVLIGTLSVKSTFFRLVSERRREIGTLLSIGFRRKHIYFLFFTESLALSVLGVLLGTLFSLALALVINLLEVPYQLGMLSQPVAFSVTMDVQTVVFSASVLIAVSVLSCWLPVYNAVRVRIIEILKE